MAGRFPLFTDACVNGHLVDALIQHCGSCSEAYIDEATTKRIETIVERLERSGVQVAIQDYAVA